MSKKIILRQSVKSGVAVVFFFGLGMASINAQTTQTTQPTGKVGINTTNPTETLDVKGKVRIQELYTDNQQTGTNNATFTATNVVTVDNNGVLGKKPLSSIIMPTIPTEPWQVAGGSTQATTNTQNIYQSGKVGIGSGFNTAKTGEGNTDVTIHSQLEISSTDNGRHLGLINGDLKWDLSAEDTNDGAKAFSITKRHYTKDTDTRNNDQGRVLSLTKDAKLFLGNTLRNNNGDNAKILVDGGQGKVGIGKNSAEYNLDVVGTAKISGLPNKDSSDTVKMVVVDNSGVLKKADIPTGGGSGNGVKNHTGSNDAVQCNAANAGTIHYKEEVLVNNNKTSVMGFCMKTAGNKYRWFYIFGGAGTTTGSEDATPNFGEGIQ